MDAYLPYSMMRLSRIPWMWLQLQDRIIVVTMRASCAGDRPFDRGNLMESLTNEGRASGSNTFVLHAHSCLRRHCRGQARPSPTSIQQAFSARASGGSRARRGSGSALCCMRSMRSTTGQKRLGSGVGVLQRCAYRRLDHRQRAVAVDRRESFQNLIELGKAALLTLPLLRRVGKSAAAP